jgi:hypothetical protein
MVQALDGKILPGFSFAYGGKDGTPFSVDRATYDHHKDSPLKTV